MLIARIPVVLDGCELAMVQADSADPLHCVADVGST
jgi:hypothetical protein